MPFYAFSNKDTGEIRDIFFHMNDDKVYNGEDGTEVGVWVREFLSPNASIDTHADIYSPKDFAKVTNKKGTIGDMWDRSAEMSAKRTEKEGIDPFKQKYFDNYKKTHKGQEHYLEKREKGKEVLKKVGISVDYGD